MYVTQMRGYSIMSNAAKREYLQAIRGRYLAGSKFLKRGILDEFCRVCNYNRKYAIRLLRASPRTKQTNSRAGRHAIYTDPALMTFLKRLWIASNLACGKRLKVMIPLWLPHYENPLTAQVKDQLQVISPATIDRLLSPLRNRYTKRGLATTKPGSLLKKHIPIKTNQWDEQTPGFLEADTVAHCGSSMAGMFTFTVNMVDIATGWTEQRAIWGKGEHGVLDVMESIEQALPFRIRGFDCDNGSEFLNWSLLKYFVHRKRPVQYTRSREYQKNDNAHVEGKNWTIVRQYLGYDRFDDPRITPALNELYTHEWRLLLNFFFPSVKLVAKQRIKSKIIKRHDAPQTPLQRILRSPHVPPGTKQHLMDIYKQLNPFLLQKTVSSKINRILRLATPDSPPVNKAI
jgi:hypothetical protein